MIVCTETVFTLHTTHTSYQLAVAPNGMVLHTYYGTRLPEDVPSLADARMPHSDPGCWPDLLPQELSGCGTADNRTPAVIPEYADGTEAAAFVFDHAVVTPGKPQLPGLPMFRTGEGVETLSVFLKDAGGLVVELRYSVYEAEDLITRTAVYTNAGTQPLTLHKAASLSVDFAPDALELITLNGTWAAERTPERAALRCGIQSIGSMRGIPGHAHNPAVALCHADTTETTGDAWGFAFVYSGNYLIEAERCDAGERLVMGIHPYHFHWTLAPGESFTAPEAAMVYSDKGLGEMSRRFHTAIRTRLLPPRWQDMAAPRPVLINSWEACYFDFDEEKLLELAQASKRQPSTCLCWTMAGSRGATILLPVWATGQRTPANCRRVCPACAKRSICWGWTWGFGWNRRPSARTVTSTVPTQTGRSAFPAGSLWRSGSSTRWISAARRW